MTSDDKGLDVAPASQPPLSHPSGAEPASAVSGKAGIANAVTFTPGPWGVHCSHIYAPDGAIIATVGNPGSKATDYPLIANRNLMAAAPELYEQVELLVRVIEYNIRVAENKGDDEGARLQSLTLAMARAALAKAQAA